MQGNLGFLPFVAAAGGAAKIFGGLFKKKKKPAPAPAPPPPAGVVAGVSVPVLIAGAVALYLITRKGR